MEIDKIDFNTFKGNKIILNCTGESYLGTVQSGSTSMLTLVEVYSLANGKRLMGSRNFHREEILKLELAPPESIINICKSSFSAETKESISCLENGKKNLFESPSKVICQCKQEKIISQLDENFTNAIQKIELSDIIGVSLKGLKLSRLGKLAWINLATKHNVFMFDIISLGTDAFCNGLKAILEDKEILKIFHDVRQSSDCLYHLYNIKLNNIFDVQVAAVWEQKNAHKSQSYAYSLNACLEYYLGIKLEEKIPAEVGWLIRPLSIDYIKTALHHVSYLRQLHAILLEKLLSTLKPATEFYLQIMRDLKNEKEIKKALMNGYLRKYSQKKDAREHEEVVQFLEDVSLFT